MVEANQLKSSNCNYRPLNSHSDCRLEIDCEETFEDEEQHITGDVSGVSDKFVELDLVKRLT